MLLNSLRKTRLFLLIALLYAASPQQRISADHCSIGEHCNDSQQNWACAYWCLQQCGTALTYCGWDPVEGEDGCCVCNAIC
jgi:hypothetical protein